jgi:RNA polymerase sigma factor (sigma-70 family)
MTSPSTPGVLRHVRGLIAGERTSHLADGELLERFARRREEAAFAALVRRHGPLVLGVCRRVLHNRHDAEDAFQATFLALARRAGAIQCRGSVGGWLHRVAYHAAVKARARALKRLEREGHAEPRASPADPLTELTGRELLALLDEELERLPEEHRGPLVLCYLEGKARDEAARALGCSLGTLKRRLREGRARLRGRLAGRGASLAALLAAGAGGAAVSPALATGTTRAALLVAAGRAAALPAAVTSLMTDVLRGLASGQRKAAGAALLALALMAATAGLFAGRAPAGGADAPRPGVDAPRSDPREMTVTGRVLDPEGRPLAGARVAVLAGVQRLRRNIGVSRERAVLGRGKADDEGRFSLVVPRTSSARNWGVDVLAGREGYGLAWQSFDPDAGRPEVSVRLSREQVIRGRLSDLQGQPAARVKLRVAHVWLVPAPARAPRDDFLRSDDLDLGDLPGDLPAWPAPVTTDEQGRFAVRGLGVGMGVAVHVVDERFALQTITVRDTSQPAEVENLRRALDPARVLEGRVSYADTGRPAAGVEVQGFGWESHGRTDGEGRFRINSYRWPLDDGGEGGWLIAYSPPGTPYCNVQKQFRWPKGAVKHTLELALPRGVLVRGSVTDEATGRPVAGAQVSYMAQLLNNPNLKPEELGGQNFVNGRDMTGTAPDGTFRIACRPGPGYLLVEGPDADYVLRENGGDERLLRGKRGGHPWYSHGFAALDLKAGAEPLDLKVTLRKGITLTGEVVGPDGRAVEDLQVFCRLQGLSTHPVQVRGHRFELHGCDPEETVTVMFLDAANRWGATARLSARGAGGKRVRVRLAPCGSARARFLDKSGMLLPDFYPGLFLVLAPKQDDTRAATLQIISPFRKVGPHTDKAGFCTFDALIPGATYQFGHAEIQATITAEGGKTVKLPDIVVE